MKKLKHLHLLFSLAILQLLILSSCGQENVKSGDDIQVEETNAKSSESTNLNISLFLDLSDRISPEKYPAPGMEVYQRDLGYIQSIAEAFGTHLKKSKIVRLNDNMQVFFEPEPMNTAINALAKEMKLSFDKNNISKTNISKIAPLYIKSSSEIYKLALADQRFVGSDIWTFFKNKVKDYCVLPNHRNILIILTDGYMYHQDNKISEENQTTYLTPELINKAKLNVSMYKKVIAEKKFGFIPATGNLQDLKVLVLGIHPEKGKNFEEDVIKQYWEDWFKAMDVKKFYIKSADLPSNLDPVIKKIILAKL